MRCRLIFMALLLIAFFPGVVQTQEPPQLAKFWTELADADPAKAYGAIWTLTKTPKESVAFIAAKLQPAAAPDPKKVQSWIEDLNSDTYAVREKANQELAYLGELAEPALRAALKAGPSLETSQRLEKLINRLLGPITIKDHLRAVRAVETLELIGSEDAKTLLTKYGAGAPLAYITRAAKETLERMAKAEPVAPWPTSSRNDLNGDPLPKGAVGRMGTIPYRRVSSDLLGLAFLPDKNQVITVGGEENETKVWQIHNGRVLHHLNFQPFYNQAFAMAPDGKRFAVAGTSIPREGLRGPSEIQVRTLPSGKLVQTFPRPPEFGRGDELIFSPDAKYLFSLGSGRRTIRIEDIALGKEIAKKEFMPEEEAAMALSADGTILAMTSGLRKGTLSLWKWREDKTLQFEIKEYCPDSISFSPDAKSLAGVDGWGGRLQVWEVPTGRLLYIQKSSEKDYYFAGKPTFSPDGKSLIVFLQHRLHGYRGKLKLLDPASGLSQGDLESTGIMGAKFAVSGDSKTLVVEAGNSIRFWDLTKRKELAPLDDGHEMEISHLVVSPKGFIATATRDGTARVWDASTGKQIQKFSVGAEIEAIALSPDSSLIAVSSLDDAVHVWELRTGRKTQRVVGHGRNPGKGILAFMPDGQGLLSWGEDSHLRLWELNNGSARFDHFLRYDKSGNSNHSWLNVAITSDRKNFVMAVAQRNYQVYDIATGNETFKFAGSMQSSRIITISPNSKTLLECAGDGRFDEDLSVSLVDLASGKTMQEHAFSGRTHGPAVFSKDGRMFAVAVKDRKEIYLFETISGKIRGTIRGFQGIVKSMAFFADSRRLASGMSDSTVLIWDLLALEPLTKES